MKKWSLCCVLGLSAVALSVQAQPVTAEEQAPAATQTYYLADLEQHNADEIESILKRAELVLQGQMSSYPDYPPLTMVLHGDEAALFTRKNYLKNKQLVDLAARLDAFHVIDLRICENLDARTSSEARRPAGLCGNHSFWACRRAAP